MATNSKVKLTTSDDWINWFNVFKTKAKNADLWDYLDPTKTNKPSLALTAPAPPDITSMRKRAAANTRSQTAGTSSSSTQDTITVDTPVDDDDPTFREGDSLAIQAQQFNDLSEKGQRVYAAMWTNYEHLNKRHLSLKKRISDLQDWVMETADEPLTRHHCLADESLTEWIKSIHDEFSLTQNERKQKARRDYRDHLARPHRSRLATYKATGDWIAQWRNTINEARDVDLQEAKEADQWFTDLTIALRASPLESWINAYSVTQINQVRANTLSVATVAADMRLALTNQPEPAKKTKVSHGAFVAASGADEDDEEEPPRDKKHGSRSSNKKRRRQSIGDDRESRCPACSLPHPLIRCYYAFPAKRPPSFRPYQPIRLAYCDMLK